MGKFLASGIVLLLVSLAGCLSLEKRQDVSDSAVRETGHSNSYTFALKELKGIQSAPEGIVKTEEAYIIVHPSYYLFFQKKPITIAPSETKNIVTTFTEMNFPAENTILNLMKIYESRESAFLSSAQHDKKLVILITPGKYHQSRTYLYKNAVDEYARYINETTHGADSVFSIESEGTDTGRIAKQDMDALIRYLKQRGVQNILIGGGYVGRCQEEFYRALSKEWPENTIALIPELSAFSPSDISETTARMLLTPDQNLNIMAANYFIKNGGIKKLGNKPNLRTAADQKISLISEPSSSPTATGPARDDDGSDL